ncbi:hypothetical protein PFISCL1PPCAC_10136, partial [Pristionchus fissidentatus]
SLSSPSIMQLFILSSLAVIAAAQYNGSPSPSPYASSPSPSLALSDPSPSSSVPGYLPDYQGDRFTNPQRIAETKALNAAFFQSIGGAPSPPPLTPAQQGMNNGTGTQQPQQDTQYYNPSTSYASTGYGTQSQYGTQQQYASANNGYGNTAYASSAQYNPSTGYYQPLSTNTGYQNTNTNNCCQSQYNQGTTYNNGYYDSSSTNCCYQGSTSSCCSTMLNSIGYSQPSSSNQYYTQSSSSPQYQQSYNQQYSTPSTNTQYYQPYGRK